MPLFSFHIFNWVIFYVAIHNHQPSPLEEPTTLEAFLTSVSFDFNLICWWLLAPKSFPKLWRGSFPFYWPIKSFLIWLPSKLLPQIGLIVSQDSLPQIAAHNDSFQKKKFILPSPLQPNTVYNSIFPGLSSQRQVPPQFDFMHSMF